MSVISLCVYVCVCVCVCVRARACLRSCGCVCVCVCVCVCTCVFACERMHACVRTRVHVCWCVYVSVSVSLSLSLSHTHAHTHTDTDRQTDRQTERQTCIQARTYPMVQCFSAQINLQTQTHTHLHNHQTHAVINITHPRAHLSDDSGFSAARILQVERTHTHNTRTHARTHARTTPQPPHARTYQHHKHDARPRTHLSEDSGFSTERILQTRMSSSANMSGPAVVADGRSSYG